MACPPTLKPEDIELIPDAWERFERAVDAVSKSGPMHRSAQKEPKSFFDAASELRRLIEEVGIPHEAIRSAARLLQRLDKCLFVKPQIGVAHTAPEACVLLQPSDLFIRYVAAVRTNDWPLVSVIEHEAFS